MTSWKFQWFWRILLPAGSSDLECDLISGSLRRSGLPSRKHYVSGSNWIGSASAVPRLISPSPKLCRVSIWERRHQATSALSAPLHVANPRYILNHMVQYSAPVLDRSFAALSDATRRGVLEQLGGTDASI